MNLSLRQLQVFRAVAMNNSFTRASEILHLSQPAVSIQVKQLEAIVGLPLFEQLKKKVYLTPAGEEMYAYACSIFGLLEEASGVIDALKGLDRGRLRLSVATTASYFATRMLAAFARLHPQVTISLDVTNRVSLLNQLEANERDLVIMGEPPGDRDLDFEPFMENPLVIVAAPEHPLACCNDIPVARLASESFIVREQGSGTRAAIERFFEKEKVAFQSSFEMTSSETIKQAVRAGLGLGIVSEHTVELELETARLVVLDVAGFPLVRHWYLAQRKRKRLSPVAAGFKEFVLRKARSFSALSA